MADFTLTIVASPNYQSSAIAAPIGHKNIPLTQAAIRLLPSQSAFNFTPATDNIILDPPCRQIHVGGAGTITLELVNGEQATYTKSADSFVENEVKFKKVEDARIPLDNNATERGIRGPVVGRKNHFGSKSKRGTEVAALFYSLIETAKLVGVDPAAYLREAALADTRREVLLPHEFKR